MFRIVLDANIFVSAILSPNGVPAQVLNTWHEGFFELVISSSIIEEIRRVLNYPKLKKFHKKSAKEIYLFLDDLEVLTFFAPEKSSLSISDDPSDDKYINAALEGGAKFLITGDNDLLKIQEYEGIKIITPREFLIELEMIRRKK